RARGRRNRAPVRLSAEPLCAEADHALDLGVALRARAGLVARLPALLLLVSLDHEPGSLGLGGPALAVLGQLQDAVPLEAALRLLGLLADPLALGGLVLGDGRAA